MALPGPQPSSGDGAANGDMVTRCAAKGTVGWAKARAARMRGRDVPTIGVPHRSGGGHATGRAFARPVALPTLRAPGCANMIREETAGRR
jgi:hypothetical protein